jgi:hypothetical protein
MDCDFLEVVDPSDAVSKYGPSLTTAVVQDMENKDFCKFAAESGFQIWDVLRERLPPEFLDAFYAGAGTFSEAVSLQAIIHTQGKVVDSSHFRHPRVDTAEAWARFLSGYRFVIGGNPHIELPSYKIAFPQASSLRINEALMFCNDADWVPFTDSQTHHHMLELKIVQARSTASSESTDRAEPKKLRADAAQLSIGILDEFIRESDLETMSLADIVRYREDKTNSRSLANFRSSIANLSCLHSSIGNWTADRVALAKEIARREVEESSLEVKKNWNEFLERIGIRVGLASAPAAAIAAFSDVGFPGVILAGGLAAAVALNAKGADDFIKLIESNRKAHSNSFSYLTNLAPRR